MFQLLGSLKNEKNKASNYLEASESRKKCRRPGATVLK